jgi:hypothetical protein
MRGRDSHVGGELLGGFESVNVWHISQNRQSSFWSNALNADEKGELPLQFIVAIDDLLSLILAAMESDYFANKI